MRIVLLGKPGSGKGTQAEMLQEALETEHLSSGQILRAEVAAGTELGNKVEVFMKRGEIGPAELITETIIGYIKRNNFSERYILDGFPRTIYQAKELEKAFPPQFAIHISVPDEIVIERLSKRLICSKCEAIYHEVATPPRVTGVCDRCGGKLIRRKDDNPEAIRKRLEIFSHEVTPIIDFYNDKEKLFEVDGTAKPSLIYNKLMKKISDEGMSR